VLAYHAQGPDFKAQDAQPLKKKKERKKEKQDFLILKVQFSFAVYNAISVKRYLELVENFL
jgi:predicted metal-dependent hydrolase